MNPNYDFDIRDYIPKGEDIPARTEVIGHESIPINVHDLTANEERLFTLPQTRPDIPCRVIIIKVERPNVGLNLPEGLYE